MKSLWKIRKRTVITALVLMGLTGLFASLYLALSLEGLSFGQLAATVGVGTPLLGMLAGLLALIFAHNFFSDTEEETEGDATQGHELGDDGEPIRYVGPDQVLGVNDHYIQPDSSTSRISDY